jgi:endonuclease-3 related protein
MKLVHFQKVIKKLLDHYGPQSWWPGETAFEVCVGAILTQNTAWTNVEKAILNLKRSRLLGPSRLKSISPRSLARLLKPAGYFNIKTKRLKAFVRFFESAFDFSFKKMNQLSSLEDLRNRLLSVHGIGRETADSILLYALERPVFVVDAYTRRIFSRHGWIRGDEAYDTIRLMVEKSLSRLPERHRTQTFNEFHALIVATGKDYCRPQNPRCSECPLRTMLPKEPDRSLMKSVFATP